MEADASSVNDSTRLRRWSPIVGVVGIALVFGFGTESIYAELDKLLGKDFRFAIRILSRLWFYSTPAGAFLGVLLGYVILRSSWLTRATICFLRVGRWAPFLIFFTLAIQLTVATYQPLSRLWISAYGALTVALTACYAFLVARHVSSLPFQASLRTIVRPVVIRGLFISLFLDMSVWAELWVVFPGKTPIGYAVFILLAIMILLLNWASRYDFDHAAADRATVLVKELKYDNGSSFWGASLLVVSCFVLWGALTGTVFNVSPIEVFRSLHGLFTEKEFYRDVVVSLGEISVGIVLGGGAAAVFVFVLDRTIQKTGIIDGLLQATQVAPIAWLPDQFGLPFVLLHKWSTLCVAVFSFYAFARAYWGLRHERAVCRILLAVDEALPYGAVAVVYGEMMNATAGLGFEMVVMGATYQTSKGLASFVTLLFLVATMSTILRWLAKRVCFSARTVSQT